MNTKTLSQLEDKFIGQPGSEARNEYEKEISNIVETGLGGKLRIEVVL